MNDKMYCFENCSSALAGLLCGLQKNENIIPIYQHFHRKSAWAFQVHCTSTFMK